MRLSSIILIVLLITCVKSDNWNGWSLNDNNDRFQQSSLPVKVPSDHPEPAQFKVKWYFKTDGPVSATPTVFDNRIYIPDNNGSIYSLTLDGKLIWKVSVEKLLGIKGYNTRNSPVVAKDMIIMGTQTGIDTDMQINKVGASVFALKRSTGKLIWTKVVDSHRAAIITANPVVVGNRILVGVSSKEETLADDPKYKCCTFQGSVLALNLADGTLIWKTKMLPDNKNKTNAYSGAAVWGSAFSVDRKRNTIYVATGNNYRLPKSIQKCIGKTKKIRRYFVADPCQERENYGQSVLALDISTGVVRWVQSLGPINAFTQACARVGNTSKPTGTNCPKNPGPDYDFGQQPILKRNIAYKFGGEKRDQIYVGQKSGQAYSFDAETGYLIWTVKTGPGSPTGGMEFGSAADNNYFYAGNNNADYKRYILPNGNKTNSPGWSSINLKTGKIRWTTVDPHRTGSAFGPLTVWNKLLLVIGGDQPVITEPGQTASTILQGCVYGLRKSDGYILYKRCFQSLIGGGVSVVDKTIYLGVGYDFARPEDGLYALQLP
ncbi:unnamed protein product [Didymodactylos carnosus]|uniref:Pyrrolo-quinoline quinone repeat domain-containing protein n=1 Tax=Didymodactylos carnosus TaxID=1234261 RepID=A0A815A8Z3_9BILA|nr:unnamed protein product [Didymodactylos carnosus]CAF1251545.1 unnamed protein product [Didymodactylos carnosus]CAF3868800.1 unnamed protein product [Didymodactylos carnosus]CAF4021447.1 unnamed protein product [Didymodactylos carnosus]